MAFPLTAGRNGNILVYDLRYSLGDIDTEKTYPIVKELCLNKCPVVAPLSVLDSEDGWKKIDLSKEQVNENLKTLLEAPDFAEKMRSDYENRPEFPPSIEPEVAIYDGFLNNADRIKVAAVRNAEPNKLADFHPDFIDTRLPDLLLHYKGRNYPQTLSEEEVEDYAKYRQDRLARQAPKFLDELKAVYEEDAYIGEELKLYYESLLDFD